MIPIIQSDIPAKVTVGTTAKNVLTLIDTTLPANANAVEVQADGGDIRYTIGAQNTPDATTGFKLEDGQTRIFVGVKPSDIKFYAGSNTTMQIAVGRI